MTDSNSNLIVPTGAAEPPFLISFTGNTETIACIKPDGTVVLYKEGADKEAAKLFWGSLQIEGQTLHQRISDLRQLSEGLQLACDDLRAERDKLKGALEALLPGLEEDLLKARPGDDSDTLRSRVNTVRGALQR